MGICCLGYCELEIEKFIATNHKRYIRIKVMKKSKRLSMLLNVNNLSLNLNSSSSKLDVPCANYVLYIVVGGW